MHKHRDPITTWWETLLRWICGMLQYGNPSLQKVLQLQDMVRKGKVEIEIQEPRCGDVCFWWWSPKKVSISPQINLERSKLNTNRCWRTRESRINIKPSTNVKSWRKKPKSANNFKSWCVINTCSEITKRPRRSTVNCNLSVKSLYQAIHLRLSIENSKYSHSIMYLFTLN